jgi:hypothetical protein
MLPIAGVFTERFEENLLPNGALPTKLSPQVSLFSVPIFGVNRGFPLLMLAREMLASASIYN